MNVALEVRDEGVLLPVKAHAGARRNALGGVHNGALKVAVTQVAEKGKANAAIIDVLAKSLGLSRSQIVLAAGATSSAKRFLVTGVQHAELARRIDQALANDRA